MLIIDDIVVLDDFLPEQYQDLIQQQLVAENVNWHYMQDITYDVDKIKEINVSESKPAFAHKFYDREKGVISPAYGLILPIVYFACDKVKFRITEIIAVRSFLTIPLPTHLDRVDHPHVDREVSHLNVLYYVCDSDGDTVFYDKTFRDISPSEVTVEELKIFQRVTPKKGRAVVFDGSRYHASTRPTTGSRIVVNFGVW
jgi:hypothetical protein